MLRFYSEKDLVAADNEWIGGRKSECMNSVDLISWITEGEMVIKKKCGLRLQMLGPFLRRQSTFGEEWEKVMS